VNKADILEFKIQPTARIAADLRSNRKVILVVAIFIALYIFISAGLYCKVENIKYFESVYFTVINVTTVGFGEIHPTNRYGEVIAIVNSIVGLVFFGFLVAAITAALQPSEFIGTVAPKRFPSSNNDAPISGVDDFFRSLASLVGIAQRQDGITEQSINNGRTRVLRVHIDRSVGDDELANVDISISIYVLPLGKS